jgi:predicted transcriptional regulator of viral defense system
MTPTYCGIQIVRDRDGLRMRTTGVRNLHRLQYTAMSGASHGPEKVALSHETTLAAYGISDVNPSRVHITVPKDVRLRRTKPKGIDLSRHPVAQRCDHAGRPTRHDRARSVLDVVETTIVPGSSQVGRVNGLLVIVNRHTKKPV